MCKGIREGLPFLATEENTNRGLTDAWLSQDGKFTATGPAVIMSAVRSCNNVDIDCARRNLRCIEDYTRNNCFSLRPADTSPLFLLLPRLLLSYSFRCIIASLRIESPFSLSFSVYRDLEPVFVARGWRLDRSKRRVFSMELSGEEEGRNVHPGWRKRCFFASFRSPRFVYFSGRSLKETNATFFFVPDIRTFVD